MRELSIEEKAKRYDEAIIRGSQLWEIDSITRGDYEYIFPELAESDDERIRQFFIHEVEGTSEEIMSYRGMNKESVLAWLEKQGEKEKFIKKELGCIKGYHEEALRRLHEIEKQGEHKPAWSEEDEVMIKVFDSIIRYIIETVDKDTFERFGTNREQLFSWLKSLKDRVQSQPKHEVDEQIETIAMHLDNCGNTAMAEILRSCNLHPQKQWKPTETIMDSLCMIINHPDRMTDYNRENLKTLYEQLKALQL